MVTIAAVLKSTRRLHALTGLLRVSYSRARRIALVGACAGWIGAALFVALDTGSNRSIFGPMKWADFPHFYTLGAVARTHASRILYDTQALDALQRSLVPESTGDLFIPVYAPITALVFAPFSVFPYFVGGALWALVTVAVYFTCVWLAWRPAARAFEDRSFAIAATLAFPAAWQLAVYGQTTAIPLLAFTAAWRALDRDRRLLAGAALSMLTVKPQLAIVITAVAVLTGDWRLILGAAAGIAAQALAVLAVFDRSVFPAYARMVARLPALSDLLEPKPYNLHSLRVLTQLLPPAADWAAWGLLSMAVIVATLVVWRSNAPLRMRFGTLVMASLLVDPHLTTYDVAILALPVAWIGGLFITDSIDAAWFWQIVFWFAVTVLVPTARWVSLQASAVLLAALFARTAGRQWRRPA